MKIQTLILLVLIFVISVSGSCKKVRIFCAENVYSFEATARVINHKDSVNIGDTIWLEVTAPVIQVDKISGQSITYSKAANLGTAIGFAELVLPIVAEAADKFDYYLVQGLPVNNPRVSAIREYSFIENGARYEFKLGIIPKQKGIFDFALSNASAVFRTTDECTKAFYRISFTETPLHLYYVNQVYGRTQDSLYNSPYFFKVK